MQYCDEISIFQIEQTFWKKSGKCINDVENAGNSDLENFR